MTGRIEFVCDDVIHWANTYHGPKFHALLCDPPYGLEFMGAEWDSFKGKTGPKRTRNQWGDFGSREHPREAKSAARVYRNKSIAFEQFCFDAFSALAEHLLPGAFLMAFGGSRTYHRMACAIEDARLIVHPAISWLYGSGFPKATRIDTQIDKAAGAEQKIVGIKQERAHDIRNGHGRAYGGGMYAGEQTPRLTVYEKEPATPLAQTWAGHRYGLQALKPAAEFICVAQKPYDGKPVESIVESGAGALAIDNARIPTDWDHEPSVRHGHSEKQCASNGATGWGANRMHAEPHTAGRWPANLVLDSDAARALDEMSGERVGGGKSVSRKPKGGDVFLGGWQPHETDLHHPKGGATSRFFFTYPAEALDDADPFFYCAKASRAERDSGLEGMPEKQAGTFDGGEFVSYGREADHKKVISRNPHPTVKPLALCRYLATLLLPPAEYAPRRLLCPFAGVMSEAIGAMQAGWDEIAAIEREAEYVEIGKARFEYWRKQTTQLRLPV